jgi:hypothetical protein
MKIRINKNQQRINFNTHVGTIITIAQQTAEQGREWFNYPISRGLGFNGNDLVDEVENRTEQSVYGVCRDGVIKFGIRN